MNRGILLALVPASSAASACCLLTSSGANSSTVRASEIRSAPTSFVTEEVRFLPCCFGVIFATLAAALRDLGWAPAPNSGASLSAQ